MKLYQHWKLSTDERAILWLTLDRADSSVNTLGRAVMSEFSEILETLPLETLKGLVIASGKSTGFVAGADVKEFSDLKTEEEAFDVIRQGQIIFDKLARLPIPTVALIKGFCMGGGTELSLACRYRVMADTDDTRIGLPEVKLGIQPGWGGTVRLTRLIGVFKAMSVFLTGKAFSAKAARAMGFVDLVVPERHLQEAAVSLISHMPRMRKANWFEKLPSLLPLRALVAHLLVRQLRAKRVNPDHYPAPYAMIEAWKEAGAKGEVAYQLEAHSISRLMMTATARNLLRVFFLQNRLKEFSKEVTSTIHHVHVIGAGTMGGDIAAYCALKGFTVTLQDREASLLTPAMKRASDLFGHVLKDPIAILGAQDRLIPDVEGQGVAKADLIIEAIFENLEAKQQLFKHLENEAKTTAILASNTSSIPLDEMNAVLMRPERLVGIHFFNPVAKMPLVEIVRGDHTDEASAKQAAKFVTTLGKFPLPVKSRPGFLVNRLLMPYMMEAMVIAQEGVPLPVIDAAAVKFGMPMGPIELADTVGLDICLSVVKNLSQAFGGTVPSFLTQKVEAKQLGKKTGQGFYAYDKTGHLIAPKAAKDQQASKEALANRMIDRMYQEALICLQEGVVTDSDLIDAGMIMGTGFAPFRGGVMQYYKERGTI